MMNNGRIKLRGAKFVLCDACGKSVACGTTDECGELTFDNLPPGRYFVREVEAPCGYEMSTDWCEVVVGADRRCECVEFINKRITCRVKVVKYGVNCI